MILKKKPEQSELPSKIDRAVSTSLDTFITNAYELEFPPYVVQRLVGHSKIEQAQTYLALRKSSEFIETEFVAYMRELKKTYVAAKPDKIVTYNVT